MAMDQDIEFLNTMARESFSKWIASAGLPADQGKQRLTSDELRRLFQTKMPVPPPDRLDRETIT